jgi:uncharacterized protein (TIGR00369 family)
MARSIRKESKHPAKKNYCFGCGADNPESMKLKFAYNKKLGIVSARINLDARFAGPPGYCHGGIIATVLDEAMAKLNKPNGVLAVTGHLAIDYRRPLPLGKHLRVEASET